MKTTVRTVFPRAVLCSGSRHLFVVCLPRIVYTSYFIKEGGLFPILAMVSHMLTVILVEPDTGNGYILTFYAIDTQSSQ